MMLDECYDHFIQFHTGYCSAVTLSAYKKNLSNFIHFIELRFKVSADQIDISCISTLDIMDYQTFLREKKCKNSESFVSTRTVITYMTDIRTFFNYCMNFDLIVVNPVRKVKIIKKDTKELLPLTIDEARVIDNYYNLDTSTGLRNYIIFHLFVDCGLRRAEVVNLKKTDINFDDHYMLVNGKGRKQRFVPLPKIYSFSMKEYFKKYNQESDYAFIKDDGAPLTAESIKDHYRRLASVTNIERLHPHFLRHTFATSYICGGGDVAVLRELLGHYDISITQNYLHEAHRLNIIHYPIYKLDKIFFINYRGGYLL